MVEPGNSFNSLFIGIGSAMKDLFEGLLPRFSFQFPFHRDRLCNAAQTGFTSSNSWTCFNSLFIGIGSAISKIMNYHYMNYIMFQFPFHRDRLCNFRSWPGGLPSHSSCFNSLFIGIGSAIGGITSRSQAGSVPFQFPFHRDRLCNLVWTRIVPLV